ncbi:Putative ribonuclease H protein At1g65750 [Linum perenne]
MNARQLRSKNSVMKNQKVNSISKAAKEQFRSEFLQTGTQAKRLRSANCNEQIIEAMATDTDQSEVAVPTSNENGPSPDSIIDAMATDIDQSEVVALSSNVNVPSPDSMISKSDSPSVTTHSLLAARQSNSTEATASDREGAAPPKSQGGLGLRKAKELNEAYMLKLGWQILKHPDKLWVRVLTTKYLKEIDGELSIRRINWGSALWRGVRRVWPTLRSACQNSVRDGMSTSFWHDSWLDNGVILADVATQVIDEAEGGRLVAEATDEHGK